MNVFENLVDELKEENLLEETVIETCKADEDEYLGAVDAGAPLLEAIESRSEDANGENAASFVNAQRLEIGFDDLLNDAPASDDENAKSDFAANATVESLLVGNSEIVVNSEIAGESEIVGNSEVVVSGALAAGNFPDPEIAEKKQGIDEKEFYRKRAVEEVSGLQMVEHVVSGIEREQMKALPKNYNDITAKKALHDFLQVSADVKSPEHAQAEFQLMQETETWCSALSHRDKRISVAHLRRFCETTRPALSSQALISLARFYRNLPFSEAVRGKFDFVVTKLFTKEDGNEKRVLIFSREELIRHLKDLYAEWSSISLYAVNDDDSSIVLAALKFEDFMGECDAANDFDELIKTDFFNRLRLFKESTEEVFFAPLVTAAAIECNARIGNRYIDLIRAARDRSDADDLQDKYGFAHDQAISDATSKTLQLVELVREKKAKPSKTIAKQEATIDLNGGGGAEREKVERKAARPTASSAEKTERDAPERVAEKARKPARNNLFKVNKWLLAATILVVLANAALYVYVHHGATPDAVSTDVKKVNLENTSLQEFLTSARISGDTFYGITQPVWETFSREQKADMLKKALAFSGGENYTRVLLLDKNGKTVGFASGEKVEVIAP